MQVEQEQIEYLRAHLFDVETKRTILGRVRARLAPHGFLMLGGAESTLDIDENFERLAGAKCSAYRLKDQG